MSLNALLFQNNLSLNCNTLRIDGSVSGGTKTAPLIINSNIACDNLNSQYWSGQWINDQLAIGDILVCSNVTTNQFVRLPVGANGTVLTANSLASLGINWV